MTPQKHRPGKMVFEVLKNVFKKPATTNYPFEKTVMDKTFRGKIVADASKCIGCKLCERDCPADAITITKVGDRQFDITFDFDRCIYCAQCVDSCMKKCLVYTQDFELAQLDKKNLKITYHAPAKPKPAEEPPKA